MPTNHFTWAMPYHPGTISLTRRAVLRRQRLVVHRVHEQDVAPAHLGDRQGALVVLLDASFDAVVGAGEHDVDGVVGDTGVGEHVGERGAGPARRADGLVNHGWLTGRGVSRARPLPAHSNVTVCVTWGRPRRSCEVEGERSGHRAVDPQSVRLRVDGRDVVVDEHVVQPRRAHVVTQHLEREPVVAGGQAQLVDRHAFVACRRCAPAG